MTARMQIMTTRTAWEVSEQERYHPLPALMLIVSDYCHPQFVTYPVGL